MSGDEYIINDVINVTAAPTKQGSLNPDISVIENIALSGEYAQSEGGAPFDVWLEVSYTDGAESFSTGLTKDEYNAVREQHPQLELPALKEGASGGRYSYSPGKTGNTLGKIVGQAPAINVSAGDANPAVLPETREEKGFWRGVGEWLVEQGENINEARLHPWEGAKGAAKGFWNLVPDMGTLIAQGGIYQSTGEMEQSAALLSMLGQEEHAEGMLSQAQEVREHVGEVNLNAYRQEMSNKAQEGGDLIATAASIFTPAGLGKGMIKTGAKQTGKQAAKTATEKAAKKVAEKEAKVIPPGKGARIKKIAHKLPCFNPYKNKKFKKMSEKQQQKYLKEYYKQLKAQQDGINSMSAKDFLDAREMYKRFKRNPAAAASQARTLKNFKLKIQENIIESLRRQGISYKKAKEIAAQKAQQQIDTLAALHEPDMVAGGWAKPGATKVGSRPVNSAIGGSWPGKRLNSLDKAAKEAVDAGRGVLR